MAMRMKYLIYFLLPLLLLSCGKEQDSNLPVDINKEGAKETYTIPYSAIINGSEVTRATLGDGGVFASGYVFQSGDRLFVSYESAGNSLYGMLTLSEGAGTSTGGFEGDLTCSAGFYPGTVDPVINFTLVGVNSATGFYTISDNKITAGPSYPSAVDYTSGTLAGMVEKYSHFTASGNYSSKSFTLQQQSVFLDFSIKFDASVLGGSTPETVSVSLKPSSDGTAIFTANNVSLTDGKLVSFVGVFQAGNDLQGQGIYVSGIHCEPDFAADLTLAANTYYSVERNTFHWDGFRIKATVEDTRVTFHSNYRAFLYYSTDGGATWTVPTSSAITLANVDDEICVLGRSDNYKNANPEGTDYGSPLGNPLFSTTDNKLVYICGNIMSLLCRPDAADYTHPENWTFGTSLPVDAFNGTFSKGKSTPLTYINIDKDDPLILPDYTAERCYKGMFRKCTFLTHGPDLPATEMTADCYNSMFRDCSSLVSVRCYFSCFKGGEYVKANYDRDNIMAWLDKWMDGITSTGNMYCHPDMVTYWNNSKNQSGPWWTSDYTKATMSKNWTASAWDTYPN